MVIFMITGDAGITTIDSFIALAIVAFPICVVLSMLEYQESIKRKDPRVKPAIRGYLFAILKGVLTLLLYALTFGIFALNVGRT